LDNAPAVFATNYDNVSDLCLLFVNKRGQRKTGLSASTTGEVLRWTARYASITFNVGGYQLPWAGMNERGLMLSTMQLRETIPPDPDERPPLDYGPLWMQYVLDTCATVEEVIAATADVRIVLAEDHYLIADRFGGGAVIEFLAGEMVVQSGLDLSVTVLTNNLYDESIATWNQHQQTGNDDYTSLDSALRRFCLGADQVTGFPPTDSETAVEYAFSALDVVSDPTTQMSIVFDTRRFRASFKTRGNHEIQYVDLFDFNLGCYAPVQMLDIHTGTSGRANDRFSDLSIPMCIDHMERYFVSVGTTVPAGLVANYHDVVETFTCSPPRRASGRVQ
jgi:choloylglycine hydrolase